MYQHPVRLDPRLGHTRIFAQVSYPVVRSLQIVPVVYPEVLDLAAWFPVVWQRSKDGWQSVVLRTLRADGSAQPPGSPAVISSLPLILRAYPFIADTASPDEIWVDDVLADEPTDVGSAILDERGQPTRGANQRLLAGRVYRDAQAGTKRITAALATSEVFAPWPLELDLPDGKLSVAGLHVIKPTLLSSGAFVSFAAAFGVAGTRMISAHSLSLYRAATLFRRARQTTAATVETSSP